MSDLLDFGFQSDIRLISVTGIGTFSEVAVKYLKECGLNDIDYFLLSSNRSSEDIAMTINSIENQWYRKLAFIVGDACEVAERELFQKAGALEKELGKVNIGLILLPFLSNNSEIKNQYKEYIGLLKNSVDQILVISNQNTFLNHDKSSPEEIAFKAFTQVMIIVKTIQKAVSCRSDISIDYWDIRSLSFKGGFGIAITANASGENRSVKALEMALESLKNNEILRDAQSFLLYLTYGNEEVTTVEIIDLMDCFMNKISPSADFLWSTGYDPELREIVQVTIIVAGLEIDSIEF